MRLILCALLALLPLAVQAQDAATPTGQEYEDSQGNTVYLPLGDASFADRAVSYTPGRRSPTGVHAQPDQALGLPDYTTPSAPGFTALGCDGSLVLQFIDNVLIDVEGTDLYVFEVGPRIESAQLAISSDGERWVEVGQIEGARSDIDIGPFVESGDVFSYVRLTNASGSCGGRTPGADIDAVAAVGAGYRLSLSGAVLFDVGESTLRPEAEQALAALAERIGQVGHPIHLIIEGHTDSTGSSESNQRLSEARATTVWEALSSLVEIDEDSVTVRGRGETSPIASNDTEEGRSQNRRVDALLLPRAD